MLREVTHSEDLLDILDVESAVLTGEIARIERDDPRGTKYVVKGVAADNRTPVEVVLRFIEADRVLIITLYVVT